MPMKWDDGAVAMLCGTIVAILGTDGITQEQKDAIVERMNSAGYDVAWNGIRYVYVISFVSSCHKKLFLLLTIFFPLNNPLTLLHQPTPARATNHQISTAISTLQKKHSFLQDAQIRGYQGGPF